MTEYSECQKKGASITTAEGRLAYAFNLLKASSIDPNGKPKFSCLMVFPKGTDFTALSDEIEAVAQAGYGKDYAKKFKVKKPVFKLVADNPIWGFDPADYEIGIAANSIEPVKIVGAEPTITVTDASQVYSGRWARMNVKPYLFPEGSPGGKGVALGLQLVQLLRNDTTIGSSRVAAEDAFTAVTLAPGQSADKLFSDNAA